MNRNLPKTNESSTFYNLNLLNNNVNIVSKTLISGAHDNVPCARIKAHKWTKYKRNKGQRLIKTDTNRNLQKTIQKW